MIELTNIEEAIMNRDAAATELTRASVARKEAAEAERAARVAYDAACVAYARLAPPDGFTKGQKVARSVVRRGSYNYGLYGKRAPDRTVTETGFITLCEGDRTYRNHAPKPGEWFVLSASGHTAYSINYGQWKPV